MNSSQFCHWWLNSFKDSNNNLSIAIENELIGYQLQFDKITDAILEMTENKPIYSQTRLNANEDKQRLQYLENKMQTMESEVCFDPLLWLSSAGLCKQIYFWSTFLQNFFRFWTWRMKKRRWKILWLQLWHRFKMKLQKVKMKWFIWFLMQPKLTQIFPNDEILFLN